MAKKKKDKPKKQRDTSKIEERAKSIANIKLPDENNHKKDNEDSIDQFYRYGRSKPMKKFKSIKDECRHKHRFGK